MSQEQIVNFFVEKSVQGAFDRLADHQSARDCSLCVEVTPYFRLASHIAKAVDMRMTVA